MERVRETVARMAPDSVVDERWVEDGEQAVRSGMLGSPTVKVNGVDIERISETPTLACRLYDGSGTPPVWLLEAAILRALAPGHALFLCVANSARSQMAEGLARSMAPDGVRISSAGSAPTRVRPEAIQALRELGVDISGQRSKRVEEVEGAVDTVVTLCADEVCPAWLEPALRVHWALPDPAAEPGGEEARMRAFRRVRDELRVRLGAWLEMIAS